MPGPATVRRILDRQVALADVARAHADALAVQIRSLQRRHAVLAAMAGGLSTEEMTTMADSERQAIRDFLDRVFGGFADQAFDGIRRSWTPVLPDEPDDAQRRAYGWGPDPSRGPGQAAA